MLHSVICSTTLYLLYSLGVADLVPILLSICVLGSVDCPENSSFFLSAEYNVFLTKIYHCHTH